MTRDEVIEALQAVAPEPYDAWESVGHVDYKYILAAIKLLVDDGKAGIGRPNPHSWRVGDWTN